jgi:hypothetical protein
MDSNYETLLYSRDSACLRVNRYNGKVHDHLSKLSGLLTGLEKASGLKPKVIVIHTIPHPEDRSKWASSDENAYVAFEDFVKEGKEAKLGRTAEGEIEWVRNSFDYPLWILFSSGTTGTCFNCLLCSFLNEGGNIFLAHMGLTTLNLLRQFRTTQVSYPVIIPDCCAEL